MNQKIEIKDLNLHFGEKHALKSINLSIPEKKIIALIGPSGCGKSTLLRSVNRMHELHTGVKITGDILLDGESILGRHVDAVDIRRKVGMVFQRPNPFPKSIFNNVAYGLKINGLSKNGSIRSSVEASLKDCYLWDELKDSLDRSALEISGGQQQRLCIARAIAVKPQVLLMDEPCSALDPISTAKIEELMLRLKNEFTIIIVTHNMQQAMRVADYTGFMYMGELVEYEETHKLLKNPAKELTIKYVSGNFG